MAIRKTLLDCLAALAMTVLLLWATPAAAQNFPEHGGSPVVDQAGLLRPEQVLDLKSKSEALYAQTGRSFVVATVKSLEGLTIEDYGSRLGRHWALGGKKDNGVILLVAPNEKKVRIETGYGAEGFLPDILAGRIIRDTILPKFRDGDMGGGIMAGADAIILQISLPADQARANAAEAAKAEQQRASGRFDLGQIIPAIVIAIIFFSIIGSLSRKTRGRRYRRHYRGAPDINPWIVLWGLNELSKASRGRGDWGGGGGDWGGGGGSSWGGGGGGGGFGGFGGGSFGGGGASGSW